MAALRLLGSHRIAAVLMGLIGVTVLLGGTLPQAGRLSPERQARWETDWNTLATWLDSVRLSDVFGSVWFLTLVCLFTGSLVMGTVFSIRTRWRLWREQTVPAGRLRSCWRLAGVPSLHLGLLVVVSGSALSMLRGFDAHLELTEGEIFAGEPSKLTLARGTAPGEFPARLRLDRTEIAIKDGKYLEVLDAVVTYQSADGAAHRATVRTNEPLELEGYRLFPDNGFGYTAILDRHLGDGSRRLLLVNFPVPRSEWEGSWVVKRNKRVDLPNTPTLFLRMELSGPRKPAFTLEVDGGARFKGKLRPGDSAEIGDFTLQFRGVAPWFGFYLARDPGLAPVFSGALLMLAGFLIHLVAPLRSRISESTSGAPARVRDRLPGLHTTRGPEGAA